MSPCLRWRGSSAAVPPPRRADRQTRARPSPRGPPDGPRPRLLPRVDDAGHRRPGPGVGALYEQDLVVTLYDRGDSGQPQGRGADVATQVTDEIGDRHRARVAPGPPGNGDTHRPGLASGPG